MRDRTAAAPTHNPNPRKPKLTLPRGACDAHFHVVGPGARFPFAPGRKTIPADAPKEALFALHDFLGIERGVIVNTAMHGADNAVTLDALAARPGRYCAEALVPLDITDFELKRLGAAGFCGARFHYMNHLAHSAPIDDVIAFGKRLADIGWHLQIHMEPELIGDYAAAIRRSATPVIIDHMGRIDASLGLEQPAFQNLLRLLEDENIWVKVSGCDRASQAGPPYADAAPFARKLVAEFGDRAVWGTDWPHPNHQPPIPDDGELVDLLAEIAPTPQALQALMVDNPQRFYHFPPLD
jgi:2-pyrone-4,6-dicarboxylate lactonase